MAGRRKDSRGQLLTYERIANPGRSEGVGGRGIRKLHYQMAEEEALMAQSEGQDFMCAFAHEFAEKCVNVLLARLPKPNVVQPRYLTVEQAAVYISHTKKSFEYLMSKKMFPVIRRDRLVLIDKNDLDAFMARQKC
jgi:hypothetical protein